MSSDLPFDCEEIFKDTLEDTDPSSLEKFNEKLQAVNDVIKTMLSTLKDEITPIAITIGAELGATGTAWLLKRIIKKAITRLIFSFITGGFNLLDKIQLAELGVTVIRGLSNTPLNIRIDKDMITQSFDAAFQTWNEELNKDRTINCMRNNFLKYLNSKNPSVQYTQEYVTEILNNLLAIYKVVRVLNSINFPDDTLECWPCAGIKKIIKDGKEIIDVSSTYIPQYCYISENSKFNLGIPTQKCNQVYRETFQNYMVKSFDPFRPSNINFDITNYKLRSSKEETNEKCNPSNPEYMFCIQGDSTGCKKCLNAPRKTTPVVVSQPTIKNTNNNADSAYGNSFNLKKKLIIFFLIIMFFILLYYIIKYVSNKKNSR